MYRFLQAKINIKVKLFSFLKVKEKYFFRVDTLRFKSDRCGRFSGSLILSKGNYFQKAV